jgi:ribulose-5-phosphate 4-epimerase/fuculose-1-phosphate aldolase
MAIPVIPKFQDFASDRQYQKQHMAAAFRYLSKQGYDEGIAGHISLRDPEHPDQFWINPLVKAFSTMKASDLVLVDEHGNILKGGNQVPINPAGFMIHSSIHKARPDVNAAVHTHSVYGKAFSALGIELDMISQDACTSQFGEKAIVTRKRSLIRTMQATFSTRTTACIPISVVQS